MSSPPQSRPRYAPYLGGQAGFRIGLRPLDPTDWMEPDEQGPVQFNNKARLLAERRGEVVAALPGSEAAQRELLTLLAQYLLRRHPELYRRRGDVIHVSPASWDVDLADPGLAPIDIAGRLVQEDLCLLQPGEGGYVLTAASLCAPSSWRLADKLGRPMLAIHDPVPGYAEAIGGRVDRILTHLKVDAPVQRANWSVMTDTTLFLPAAHAHPPERLVGLIPQTAGERLFLRVERQTLRRLPETGAIVFGIRTYLDPLAVLAPWPDLAAGLYQAVSGVSEEMAAYKAISAIREPLLGWLERKMNRL